MNEDMDLQRFIAYAARLSETLLEDEDVATVIRELEGITKADTIQSVTDRYNIIQNCLLNLVTKKYDKIVRQMTYKMEEKARQARIEAQGGI